MGCITCKTLGAKGEVASKSTFSSQQRKTKSTFCLKPDRQSQGSKVNKRRSSLSSTNSQRLSPSTQSRVNSKLTVNSKVNLLNRVDCVWTVDSRTGKTPGLGWGSCSWLHSRVMLRAVRVREMEQLEEGGKHVDTRVRMECKARVSRCRG